jgi:hypothetical protein
MNLFKLTPLSTMLAALFSAPALASCPGIAPTAGNTNPLPYPAMRTPLHHRNLGQQSDLIALK